MTMPVLQASMPLHTLSKRLSLSSALTLLHTHRWRPLSCQMSADSSHLTHSITLPIQLAEPVQIVAAHSVSESEFRRVTLFFLFHNYEKKMLIAERIIFSYNTLKNLVRLCLFSVKTHDITYWKTLNSTQKRG